MHSQLRALLAASLLVALSHAVATEYKIEAIAEGLEHPWSIAWLPDGTALVTERPGRLRMIRDGRLLAAPIDGVPAVHAASQGGLFEALPDPNYANNGWLYLSYAYGTSKANATRVARARLENMRLVDLEVLFTASPMKDTPVHYGGRMTWLPDATLLIGLGDGFDFREQAQKLNSHLGTLVRINTDGSIPADNPFIDRDDVLPEIYSYGHRNIQGLVHDADSGRLWQHEHGPRGGDEINLIEAGGNYGWPVATHGIDYSGAMISPFTSRPGMIEPEHVWTPSIAPAGMTLYRGTLFPQWDGRLLVAALAARHARVLTLDGAQIINDAIILDELGERLRDIRTGPDGAVWVLTDANPGTVLRLSPDNPDH
ncbi:MAG: PQQ-dependent sugar dehydrogenase [Xanthomonadaceae bacterium]|nr:PQQ-dependent sugar dehydrogenase [Xanthomonadaceae bacterium]